MNEAGNAFVYRLFDQVFNLGDLEDLSELLSPECKSTVSFVAGLPLGTAGFAPFVAVLRDAFGSLYVEIKNQAISYNSDAVEVVDSSFGLEGIHRGEILGIEATGNPIVLQGRYRALVRAGKIIEQDFDLSLPLLLEQLKVGRKHGQ